MIAHIFIIFRIGKKIDYDDYLDIQKNLSDKNKELIKDEGILHIDFGGNFIDIHCHIDNIMELTANLVDELLKKDYTPNVISPNFKSGENEVEEWEFLRGALKAGLSFLEDRKKEIINNDCECTLINGVLERSERGKKCNKSKEEHLFINR